MTEPQGSRFGPADVFQLWADTWAKTLTAGLSAAPDATPPDAFRQARGAMFDVWSDYFQRFTRSPEFLESLRQSLSMNIEFRKHLNDLFGQIQYNLQAASRQDVDQLMGVMRHLEQRVIDSTERLNCRVEELGRCLERLEKARSAHE